MLDVQAKSKRIENEMFSEMFERNQLIDVKKQLLSIADTGQVVVLTAPSDWKRNTIPAFEESMNAYLEQCGIKIRVVVLPPGFGCACHFRSNGHC